MARIFINYRREDTSSSASRLYEWLTDCYGEDDVFKDVDSIAPGLDWAEAIESAVGSSDLVLALIGNNWLAELRRHLDDEDDLMRLELETALGRRIRLMPILVDGAKMPRAGELPESLAGLVRRQAFEVRDERFRFDKQELLKRVDRVLGTEVPTPPQLPTLQPPTPVQADRGTDAGTGDLAASASQPPVAVPERPRAAQEKAPPEPPPPPASPEPPASDHRSGNSRRFPRLVIPMTLLGALVGAGVAYVIVHDGNSSTDHETRPGMSGSVYDEIVLPHVPANIQNTCRETRQPSDVQPGAGQGTASCTVSLPQGSVRLWYTKVHNSLALRDSFFEVTRRELNLDLPNIKNPRRTTGDCQTKARAWTFWHRPLGSQVKHHLAPASRVEGEVTAGRVICFPHGSNAVIEWTDRETEIYAIAESTAGIPQLITWYTENGGPLLNPSSPMHGGDSRMSSGGPLTHHHEGPDGSTTRDPVGSK